MILEKLFDDHPELTKYIDLSGELCVPLRPVCEIMKLNANDEIHKVLKDAALREVSSFVEISPGVFEYCIQELFFYGWLLNLDVSSPDYLKFKKKTYKLIYNHFKGSLTKPLSQ